MKSSDDSRLFPERPTPYGDYFNHYICPNCKRKISCGDDNYCSECGQAFDWSFLEDEE